MEPRYAASIAATRGLITPSRRPAPDGYSDFDLELFVYRSLKDKGIRADHGLELTGHKNRSSGQRGRLLDGVPQ
jgi:hypothetical protein